MRLEGTCGWILKTREFATWVSPEFAAGVRALWIHGPPGFGKTVLCAHIVRLLTKGLPCPVAHFFFSSDSAAREDPFVALRTWISQLIRQSKDACDVAVRHFEDDVNPAATRGTVLSLFKDIVRVVPDCILVTDSLDECTNIDLVAEFLECVIAAMADSNCRILVVSRSLSAIKDALRSNMKGKFLEFQIRPEHVQSDIRAYSRAIVDRKLENRSPDVRSDLSSAMAERCKGQFIWLKLHEKSLRRGAPPKQLAKAVEATPTELSRVYDKHWERIMQLEDEDRQHTLSLLRWAAFALKPLTTQQAAEARLMDDDGELAWDYLPEDVDEDYVDTELVSLCSPLLEVRGCAATRMWGPQTVHLPHFTVRQYLLCNLPVPNWLRLNDSLHISQEELQNTVLAKACLQYIRYRRVWDTATCYLEPGYRASDVDAELGASLRYYAATAWHRHFNKGWRRNADIIRDVTDFLTEGSPARDAWSKLL